MPNDFSWWPRCQFRRLDGDGADTWGPAPAPMPDEVPILSAKNIRQDGSLGDGDCRCLLGWSAGFPVNHQRTVDDAVQVVMNRRGFDEEIDSFSDAEDPKLVAEVWNEAMGDLGYDEPFLE